jgi:hypothetical protein
MSHRCILVAIILLAAPRAFARGPISMLSQQLLNEKAEALAKAAHARRRLPRCARLPPGGTELRALPHHRRRERSPGA